MTSSTTSTSSVQSAEQAARGRRTAGILIVVMMGFCLLFVGGYVQRTAEKAAVEAQIVAMHEQIGQAKVRSAVLTKELAQVNDEAHIAAIARNNLNLVQEGDQLIAVIDAPAAEASVAAPVDSVRLPTNTTPNWQRWLDLLLPLD